MTASAEYVNSATSLEPNDFFHFMKKPGPSDLASKVDFWLGNYFCHSLGGRYKVGNDLYVRPAGIVEEGLIDTQAFLHDEFDRGGSVSPEEAARIAFSSSTLDALARKAMQTGGGCPHAVRNGEIYASPLFIKLATWSGALAIQSYFTHRRNIDPTEVLEKGYDQRYYTRFASAEAADDRSGNSPDPMPDPYNPENKDYTSCFRNLNLSDGKE